MNTPLVLTIIADDQPGIIKTVSEVLYEFGGSWTESSMASLAGQFAGILLASVPDSQADACVEALQALQEKDLHVIAHLSRKTVVASADNREFVLDLVGNNRRGIVHDITAILARHNINVHNLETVAESVAMGGGELFKAKAKLVVPTSVDIEVLESELEAMANELMVDIRLQH